ncbi:MAG: pantoate--beta-alanine ligase [Desulfobacterales bacterium]|nr:pantoate--beta-alanine ligase [Desulfobacterales bacterium]MDD4072770.1 pantoate--beta-alanine ligase [Desulfobacterales bacterium]MDD4391366.1 pantoate--beta-alanine ligase [Desulfobacterales bacterium]
MTAVKIIRSANQMQEEANRLRSGGKTLALVPTMGYLHEGHLSLMRLARQRADILVVSIFVNPTQFGPGEDLASYPKSFERDVQLAGNEGADFIFAPSEKDLYPDGFQTYVTLQELPGYLCGRSRPVHFRGVATVVTKLFNIVKPHTAVFGQKDYQQLVIIRRLARDLNFDIDIVGSPTVREPDGLAKSSRNLYLTPVQRRDALCLYQSLQNAQAMVTEGVTDTARIVDRTKLLIQSCPEATVDYISLCDPETLKNVDTIKGPVIMALAVKIGKSRLIDNAILNP